MKRLHAFPNFQGFWIPIDKSKAVAKKRLASYTVDGTPVLVHRDSEGGVHALLDRCPHRSVKLSLGKVTENGSDSVSVSRLAI